MLFLKLPSLFLLFQTLLIQPSTIIATDTASIDSKTDTSHQHQHQSDPQQSKCERLKTSLTYSQENAPQDISAVLPLIVERVNRELSGVVDVEVLFTGSEIHRRVGKHTVQCSVTRLLSVAKTADDSNGGNGGNGGNGDSDDSSEDQDDLEYQTKGVDEDGRDVVTQCFLVPFTILDVDECKLPMGHSMRHTCTEPASCINTQGSYECLCPTASASKSESELDTTQASSEDENIANQFWKSITDSETTTRTPWEKSLSSSKQSSCPAKASTYKCCDSDAHSIDGQSCRSNFKCPIDPCSTTSTSKNKNKNKHQYNDCVSNASCIKADTPLDDPTFTCQCPKDLMGTGHKCRRGVDVMPPQPKVKFDGVTPTDETIQNRFYCGCTKPIVDHCAGYEECTGRNQICAVSVETKEPHCVCKPGYVHVDTFGCVDESPPTLKLRHDDDEDNITYLKQGDMYKEYAVDVIDDNAEDYKRSLKITYSRPLPDGCETHIGSFQVNYTVAMPWTNPPYVRVTRDVIIEDIDECNIDIEKYETQCPQIIPHCDIDHGAVCKNTNGSYTCQCPKYTSGDGFQFISSIQTDKEGNFLDAPVGYKGGLGCVDTSKPVIKVLGPNPKIFRTPKCGGLSGIMKNAKKEKDNEKDNNLVSIQRSGYEDDIKNMILATTGAELCATSTRTNPRAVDCVRATDHTYLGNVDLSSKVTVGTPVQLSSLEWKVPYNVMDEAGNAATTVWRQIIVDEIDLFEMEERIRADVLADKDMEVKEAVRIALEQEREKQSKKDAIVTRGKNGRNGSCPTCPKCDCPKRGKELSVAQCNKQCEEKMKKKNPTCDNPIGDREESETVTLQYLLEKIASLTEEAFSSTLIVVAVVVFVISVQVLRMVANAFSRRGGWYYLSEDDERQEEEMLNSVTYFSPEGRRRDSNGQTPSMSSRTSPMPTANYFSPEMRQRQSNGHLHSMPNASSPMPAPTYFSPEARRRQNNGHAPPTASLFSPMSNSNAFNHGS